MTRITHCPKCNSQIALYDSLLGDYPIVLECPECGWQKEQSKQWGGAGRGQGLKSTWKNKPTKAIKVPEVLVPQVMEYARALDRDELPDPASSPWQSLGDVLGGLPHQVVAHQVATPPAATQPSAKAIALLTEALSLKANAGGAIKVKIKEALKLLVQNGEE